MEFEKRTAYVTGVSHGIGKAIALQLAKEGVTLYLCDINKEGLMQTAKEAAAFGVRVEREALDVANEKGCFASAERAIELFGKIDILINNAGIYNTFKPFIESTVEEWKEKININILGTMYLCKAFAEHMISNCYGRIINIGSVAGVYGIRDQTEYSMTKGAVIAFTKALAKNLTPYGITVNAVSPGSISVNGQEMPEHSFAGRAGTADECASVIVFLASDGASYVSGQNYLVDGCRKMM